MLKRLLIVSLLIGCLGVLPGFAVSGEYKIGVLSNMGGDQALKDWKATAAFLSVKLGKPFSIVPLGDRQMYLWAREGKLDFFFADPAMYAELHRDSGVQAIATVISNAGNAPTDKFGAVIIVKKDSPVQELADFRGRTLMCRGKSAFGGWGLADQLFRKNGIDPEKEFKRLRETTSYPNVVFAVMYGNVDGGVVRTGSLELLARAGKIKLEDFRVIHQVNDGFPLLHSTELYHESPMAACPHIPRDLKDEVALALQSMLPTDQAAVAAKIAGFTVPASYPIEVLTIRHAVADVR